MKITKPSCDRRVVASWVKRDGIVLAQSTQLMVESMAEAARDRTLNAFRSAAITMMKWNVYGGRRFALSTTLTDRQQWCIGINDIRSMHMTNLANEQALAPISASAMEAVLIEGDLAKLSNEQRVLYYQQVCQSLGLNPLTQPFAYLKLNNKLVLYAKRDCTDQLRRINNISIQIVGREEVAGCYVVTAQASTAQNRQDESLGAVPIEHLKGEARANALMKCETKAKRRVTLSICGLAFLDESELESVQGASHVTVNAAGEITGGSQQAADEMLDKKLAAIAAGTKPRDVSNVLESAVIATPPDAPEQPKSKAFLNLMKNFEDILGKFQKLYLEDIYYDHLKAAKVSSADKFTDDEKGFNAARKCFKGMAEALSELEVAAKKVAE